MRTQGAVPVFGDPQALADALSRAEALRGVAGADLCGLCGRPRPSRARYCSPACRFAAWKARKARAKRERLRPLKPTTARILARLEQGPATASELAQLGGKRYGARIHELRQRGHRIACKVDRIPGEFEGFSVYRLDP